MRARPQTGQGIAASRKQLQRARSVQRLSQDKRERMVSAAARNLSGALLQSMAAQQAQFLADYEDGSAVNITAQGSDDLLGQIQALRSERQVMQRRNSMPHVSEE